MKKKVEGSVQVEEVDVTGQEDWEKSDRSKPGFGSVSKDMNPYPNVKKTRHENSVDLENVISSDEKLVKKFRDQ